MMNDQERKTHFQGFAKLLWQDLLEANEYGYIDVRVGDDGIDPTDYITVIAERAYDLAIYLYEFVPMLRNTYPNLLTVQEVIRHIPDLTTWPTPE